MQVRDAKMGRERESGARGNFGEMRGSGWVQTGHVKRNESRSRTWLGRDPRYPDHRSRSASFLCQEFKLDTTTLHPQPLKLAPRLPNHPGDTPLFHGTLFDRAARSAALVFVFKRGITGGGGLPHRGGCLVAGVQ